MKNVMVFFLSDDICMIFKKEKKEIILIIRSICKRHTKFNKFELFIFGLKDTPL